MGFYMFRLALLSVFGLFRFGVNDFRVWVLVLVKAVSALLLVIV